MFHDHSPFSRLLGENLLNINFLLEDQDVPSEAYALDLTNGSQCGASLTQNRHSSHFWGIPSQLSLSSTPSVMALMPNCMVRHSNGLSEAGCKPVWTGDTSKGCSSRLFSCIGEHRMPH